MGGYPHIAQAVVRAALRMPTLAAQRSLAHARPFVALAEWQGKDCQTVEIPAWPPEANRADLAVAELERTDLLEQIAAELAPEFRQRDNYWGGWRNRHDLVLRAVAELPDDQLATPDIQRAIESRFGVRVGSGCICNALVKAGWGHRRAQVRGQPNMFTRPIDGV